MTENGGDLYLDGGFAYSQLLSLQRESAAAETEREEAEYALSEAARMAKDCEHKAALHQARVAAHISGKNAATRNASIMLLLEEDNEYKNLTQEARAYKATQSDIRPRIRALDAKIRRLERHMDGLIGLMKANSGG